MNVIAVTAVIILQEMTTTPSCCSFHFAVIFLPALSPNLAENEYGILRQDPECSVCVLRRIAVFFLSFCCCYIAWPG